MSKDLQSKKQKTPNIQVFNQPPTNPLFHHFFHGKFTILIGKPTIFPWNITIFPMEIHQVRHAFALDLDSQLASPRLAAALRCPAAEAGGRMMIKWVIIDN